MFHAIAKLGNHFEQLIEFLRCEINFAKHKELFLRIHYFLRICFQKYIMYGWGIRRNYGTFASKFAYMINCILIQCYVFK